MSRIKRTVTSIFHKVDQVVGEIENQDALIQAAIREQQSKLNAARVECNRVTQRYLQTNKEADALQQKKSQWEARAVQEAGGASSDSERALACLQRAEGLSEQIAQLETTAKQYQVTAEKMALEIKQGGQGLEELKQKHQFMRARQATADALGKFGDVGATRLEEVEASFDRWEVKIGPIDTDMEVEFEGIDDLEREYVAQENKQKLNARLQALLADANNQGET